jgi:DNA-binding HxlR family transcriptional regulator
MKKRTPTNCPIVFSLDIFGDKWSLVILRDILFSGKRHFRELLTSDEKIASNILSTRLESLVRDGMLTKAADETNKSASVYTPTQKALDLVPALVEIMRWGISYNAYIDKNNPFMSRVSFNSKELVAETIDAFL